MSCLTFTGTLADLVQNKRSISSPRVRNWSCRDTASRKQSVKGIDRAFAHIAYEKAKIALNLVDVSLVSDATL